MTTQTVSFDEFQEALREERAVKTSDASKIKQSLETFVEKPLIQLVTLCFIYLDIIAQCGLTSENPGLINWSNAIYHVASIFFCCELLMQASIFNVRFFAHWGYLVDTMLIGLRLARKLSSFQVNQQHLVFLNFLRIWRFARLLHSYVDIEKQKHDATKMKLKRKTKWWKEKALLSEDFVKVCNEEVKTLREALNIAAKDVASAMLGQVDNGLLSRSVGVNHENETIHDNQVVMENSSISTED